MGLSPDYAMAEMDAGGDVMLDRLHIEKSEFGSGLAADIRRTCGPCRHPEHRARSA